MLFGDEMGRAKLFELLEKFHIHKQLACAAYM
jgi:hypothetical protein